MYIKVILSSFSFNCKSSWAYLHVCYMKKNYMNICWLLYLISKFSVRNTRSSNENRLHFSITELNLKVKYQVDAIVGGPDIPEDQPIVRTVWHDIYFVLFAEICSFHSNSKLLKLQINHLLLLDLASHFILIGF